MKFLYQHILKPFLFLFDPERVHNWFVFLGEFFGKFRFTRSLIAFFYQYKGTSIAKTVDGITYRTPIMLAAGFDYNGRLVEILDTLSFGGNEIGSVTAKLTPGNPKPRLRRMIKSKAFVVYKGLKNEGVEAIIQRLKKAIISPNLVVGVSIAKTNDATTVKTEDAIADYCYSFKKLNEEQVGSFYTINISCPNVHGGESFTSPDLLAPLMTALDKIPCNKPIYVKMPINLEWEEFNILLRILDKSRINGVVIGNLNKKYEDADFPEEAPKDYRGGLSGKVCRKLSTDLIRKTKQEWGSRFTIIGCGGILSVEDAMEKLDAGADLLQLISGMIYEGPHLMKEICEELERRKS
jgi:dihydroorotate dehydrogenase